MADEDPRDHALFGAAWLTGYVAALSGSRIQCITLGGFTGPRGILGSAGDRYPNFAVAKHIANAAGMRRLICKSNDARRAVAFGAIGPSDDASIFVANLTEQPQSVCLAGQKTLSLRPFECRELVIPARRATY
jgi:D-apionolactonase